MRFWITVLLGLSVCLSCHSAEPTVSFQKQIVPILVDRCLGCHNSETTEGEYSMATFDAFVKGGVNGVALEAGKPESSLLWRMLVGQAEPAMPFEDDPLDAASIELIKTWIAEGASFDGPNRETPIEEMAPEEESMAWDPNYRTPVPISALAFSPDGAKLAASGYREITFWDPSTGKLLGRWSTKCDRISRLAYTRDGKYLVHAGGTPGRYGEVAVWDVASGMMARRLFEGKDMVFGLSIRPGAAEVAAGGCDRIFRIWNMEDGKELHSVENHADWILDLAYTPDGKRLLTASRDRSAKVWDQTTAEPILTFSQHTDGVHGVASNPDATIAASVGADKHLRLWKTDGNGDQTAAIGAHSDAVTAVQFATDGTFVVTAGTDKRVVAWNPADHKAIREFTGHEDFVYSLALSPDDSRLAAGGWDGSIRVWKTDSGELITEFIGVPALATVQASAP